MRLEATCCLDLPSPLREFFLPLIGKGDVDAEGRLCFMAGQIDYFNKQASPPDLAHS